MVDSSGRLVGELAELQRENETLRAELAAQQQAITELRANEWRYRRLNESGVIGIATFNPLGAILDANDTFLEMIGFSRAELAAGEVRWNRLTPPEWMPRTLQAFEELHTRGWCTPYEKEYFRRDGSRFWGLFGSAMRRNGSEGVAFVLDITARKELERAEREARETAEAGSQRLAFLAEAGERLAASLEEQTTLQKIAELAVPRIADGCLIELLGADGRLERAALVHPDTGRIALFDELERRYPRDVAGFNPAAHVLRTGKAQLWANITAAEVEAFAQDSEHLELLRQINLNSFMIVPLRVHSEIIGALSLLMAGSGRYFTQDDLLLAEAFASRAGMALHNAQLFRQTAQLNQQLEERVQQRTAQLQNVNTQLEEEVAERRRTEAMVRERERLYRTLVQNIPDGTVMLLDKKLRYVLVEGELVERLGLAFEDYTGKYVRDFLQPEVAAQRLPHYEKALAGTPDTAQIHFRGRTYLSRAVPLHDEQGEIEGVLVLIQDIEELTQARLEVEQRARQLVALAEMGQMVTSTLDVATVLQRVLEQVSLFIPAEAVIILLREEDELHCAAANGRATPLQGKRLRDSSGVAHQVIQDGRPVYLQPSEEVEYLAGDSLEYGTYHVRTIAAVPLKVQDTVIGVLEAVHSEANRFTNEHLQWLEAAANWTAIAVSNARLFEETSLNRARLEGLTQQLVTAQEEERQRIARELHDEAGQALTALTIMLTLTLQGLRPEAEVVRAELEAAIELTQSTMEQIRLLSHDLHPPAFDAVGLNNVLEGFCQDFANRTHLSIHYTGLELPTLSRLVNISLYRLLQETLTNAAKHAQATEIEVSLTYNGRLIRLTVRDNGQGFDLETRMVVSGQPGGIGLLGMQERFRLLDGWVEIESKPGQGTQVVGVLPWTEEKA